MESTDEQVADSAAPTPSTPSRFNADWLDAFVQYAAPVGEAPLDIYWWVGVATIAGALRRRVWIDQKTFQWVPNFYIVVVAPPGIVAKSTTQNVGFDLLREIETVNFGPDISSWEALVKEIGELGEEFETPDGGHYSMSAITLAIDEYGTFIDPYDRKQVDNLTALWDGKRGTIRKSTKSQGTDVLVYPWVNWFACTTPNWIEKNFPESFLASGFMSRNIFLVAKEKRQKIPYPEDAAPENYDIQKIQLISDLRQIAAYAGAFRLTPEAKELGRQWYFEHWAKYEKESQERLGFPARWQTHLHKLAMVISAARGAFPDITPEHMILAREKLLEVEPYIRRVLAVVGTTNITRASREIVEFLKQEGRPMSRREFFGKYFFRRLSMKEFEEAIAGAVGAGYIDVGTDNILRLKRELEV